MKFSLALRISCAIMIAFFLLSASPPNLLQPEYEMPQTKFMRHLESLQAGQYVGVHPQPKINDSTLEPTDIAPWTKLTFQRYIEVEDNWEIYSATGMDLGQTRLTTHVAIDLRPDFNRGCTKLVFYSNRNGNFDIYSMNPDGSSVTRLTTSSADDYNPVWSPDGSRIAFQSERDGQSEIYVMNANGTSQTRVTTNSGYDGEPSWSPDGAMIAFHSYRNSQHRIWKMNANGSSQTQVNNTAYSENPVWSQSRYGEVLYYDADATGDGWWELWAAPVDGRAEVFYCQDDAGKYYLFFSMLWPKFKVNQVEFCRK